MQVRKNHEKVTSQHNTKLFSWLQKYSSVDQYEIRRRGEKLMTKVLFSTKSERKSGKKKIRVKHQREKERESCWNYRVNVIDTLDTLTIRVICTGSGKEGRSTGRIHVLRSKQFTNKTCCWFLWKCLNLRTANILILSSETARNSIDFLTNHWMTGKMWIKSIPCRDIWWGSSRCGHCIPWRTRTSFSVKALFQCKRQSSS